MPNVDSKSGEDVSVGKQSSSFDVGVLREGGVPSRVSARRDRGVDSPIEEGGDTQRGTEFTIHSERLGRTYYFRTESAEETKEWVGVVESARRSAVKEAIQHANLSCLQHARKVMKIGFNSTKYQAFSATLLACNFVVNIISTEMMSHSATHGEPKIFDHLDFFFTAYYLVELCVSKSSFVCTET